MLVATQILIIEHAAINTFTSNYSKIIRVTSVHCMWNVMDIQDVAKSPWERTEVRVTFWSGVFKDRNSLDMMILLMCVLK
jgi:hypothetical protein